MPSPRFITTSIFYDAGPDEYNACSTLDAWRRLSISTRPLTGSYYKEMRFVSWFGDALCARNANNRENLRFRSTRENDNDNV